MSWEELGKAPGPVSWQPAVCFTILTHLIAVGGITGGLGDGVGKIGKGDVAGGLSSALGGVYNGLGGLAGGVLGGVQSVGRERDDE